MAVSIGVLQRQPREWRLLTEQPAIDLVLRVGVRVQHDVMAVRIETSDVAGHCPLLLHGLGVFFAEVPVDGEQIAKARDHLAQIQPPFRSEVAAVERLADGVCEQRSASTSAGRATGTSTS